jgi:hypothetical protein
MNRASKNTALLIAVALLFSLTAAPLGAASPKKSGLAVDSHFPVGNTVQVLVSNGSDQALSGYVTVNALVNGVTEQSQEQVILGAGESASVTVRFSGRVTDVVSSGIFEDPNPV